MLPSSMVTGMNWERKKTTKTEPCYEAKIEQRASIVVSFIHFTNSCKF